MAYVRRLTGEHGENFHVLSRLVPARLVDDFCSVYAFCRWADDLSDESGSPERARELLQWWGRELDECFAGRAEHPVFVALRGTIERRRLPIRPFRDLLSAFTQDQDAVAYGTWGQLLDYCSRSAAPVGRLVLMLFDERSPDCQRPSDATCHALQLVNFWQDVRRDLADRGRIYIPADVAAAHGLDLRELRRSITTPPTEDGPTPEQLDGAYRSTMRDLCDRTAALFEQGRPLLRIVGREARPVLKLFSLGGEAVLRSMERANYGTHLRRPRLGRAAKAWLLGRVWLSHTLGVA